MTFSFNIRKATPADVPIIRQLIVELADYERRIEEAQATDEQLLNSIFGPKAVVQVLMAEVDAINSKIPVGFALYFYNYSTFQGKPGIYIEDIYVQPEYRGYGIGKAFFQKIAAQALEEDCGRVEWSVLTWNQPAIDFYEKMDAKCCDEWVKYRLSGEALAETAQSKKPTLLAN